MSDSRSSALVSVRVKSKEAARSSVLARRHQFSIGRAITFDREDPEISAMEMVIGAAGSDVLSTFRKIARERRIVLDELEAAVQGDLNNALTYLGVIGEEGDPSLRSLTIKVYASTGAPDAEVRAAWSAALARSPLAATLGRCVDLKLDLQIAH